LETWAHSVGLVAAAALFAVVGWYLTLIAKFYRLKFKRGPHVGTMQVSLAVLLVGWLMRFPYFTFLPSPLSAIMVVVGAAVFSWLAYALYRTMMSIH
jgi:hypothetical protein